jgi:hypothetical protein
MSWSVNVDKEAVFRIGDWDGRKAERGILHTKAEGAVLKHNIISFELYL